MSLTGDNRELSVPEIQPLVIPSHQPPYRAQPFQAADIFTRGGLGYAPNDGKVERVCSAPVTTHWTSRFGLPRHRVMSTNERWELQLIKTLSTPPGSRFAHRGAWPFGMVAVARTPAFGAFRPGEGALTERTAGVQPARGEQALMPQPDN
jgi:hypothetical protein